MSTPTFNWNANNMVEELDMFKSYINMHIMDAFPNITEDKEVIKIKETTRPHRPTKETTRPHRPTKETTRPHRPYERNHTPTQAIRKKPRAYTGPTKETTRLHRPYKHNGER